MDRISDRINNMALSATLAMTQKSRDLAAKGFDVINLSIGEPDFNTPDHIKQAAIEAINDNITFYPPVPGFPSLRKVISEKFKRENNLDFSPDQIVVSAGAKHSIINTLLCIVNKGDEVIVPAPYWVSYVDMIKLAEGVPMVVECELANDFKMTAEQLESAISPKTKALLYSSPSNPTGDLYSESELKQIAEVLAKYPQITVISDEIYEHINFSGKHVSIAIFEELKDRVVVVNGVSKGYAMTGWRIGYVGAPMDIAKACTKLQGQFTSGACTIAQMAAQAAISAGSEACAEMTKVFQKRLNIVLEHIKEIPGFIPNRPQGAFYVFPDVSAYFGKSDGEKVITSSDDLALYILDKAKVATVAGTAFGSPKCLRISYATSEDKLNTAMNRIKDVLSKLN
jgi:aspartate aminotransferase